MSRPAPTLQDRAAAAEAARALRRAIDDPSTIGAPSTGHIDMCRPRRGVWFTTWANLPGFVRAGAATYSHALLPGWSYARAEIKAELIPDLEALAEHGVRPTEATSR